MRRVFLQLLIFGVLSGEFCSLAGDTHYQFINGKGDAGPFILKTALARRAQVLSTNGLPLLTNAWTYEESSLWTILRLAAVQSNAVHSLFTKVLGKPTSEGDLFGSYCRNYTTTDGGPLIWILYDAQFVNVNIGATVAEIAREGNERLRRLREKPILK